jgi:hypothetical protein
MAYISNDEVNEMRKKIKKEFPAPKYSFSITNRDYSAICVCVLKSPLSPLDQNGYNSGGGISTHHRSIPDDWKTFISKLEKICYAGNHDNSDAMTDYFDVGWYVDINYGKWDKPYVKS